MNAPLWTPSAARIASSRLRAYQTWLQQHGIAVGYDYRSLYDWSIAHGAEFWSSLWDFFGVIGDRGSARVVDDTDGFIAARFFPDASLNFAENLHAEAAN